MTFALARRPNFTSPYCGVNACLGQFFNSVLNVKVLVGAFNQQKVLLGAFSVIVKTGCGTDGALHSTTFYFFYFYLFAEVKSSSVLLSLIFCILSTHPFRKNVQFHRQRKLLKCKLVTFDITNYLLKIKLTLQIGNPNSLFSTLL